VFELSEVRATEVPYINSSKVIYENRLLNYLAFQSFDHELMKVITETYLMKVILETYLMKVILETYLMKVIPETYMMKVIPETRRPH
jgi:hypothetical protein